MTADFEIANADARRAGIVDVLKRAEAEGIERVRLSFADQHGLLRGKTLPLSGLARAFEVGVPMTSTLLLKDTAHKTVFPVWSAEGGYDLPGLKGAGDVIMLPDPETFRVLPWAEATGWLLCDLYLKDGRRFPFCTRTFLRQAEAALAEDGYGVRTGLEMEFTILRLTDLRLDYAALGQPPAPPETAPVTKGYQYLTESVADILDPVYAEVHRLCDALSLPLRSLEVEFGPSQMEATFEPQGALATADATVLFRSAVKQALRRQGYHASFMCRPALPELFSNGWHIHQSLTQSDGANAFAEPGRTLSSVGEAYLAGLLTHAAESCLLTTPTVNGYKRYRPFVLAPDRILWGLDNKGAMLRAVGGDGDPGTRIENRAPEPAANPYLCLASQLVSGRDGITRSLTPPPPTDAPYAEGAHLPRSLMEAIEAFAEGSLYRRAWGDEFVNYLLTLKRAEVARFLATVTDWEQREYFEIF
jgi:glutamine synthetase